MATNKGTGAGGAATNANGKTFEEKTSNEPRLLANGFTRKPIPGISQKSTQCSASYLGNHDDSIVYLSQRGLANYFAQKFTLELFRCPDEAYLLRKGDRYTLKILEKKNQNVAGSVDTKLLAGPGFLEEYAECLGPRFDVEYAFCLSSFLQKAYVSADLKYNILRRINERHGIAVLFGDDTNYTSMLDQWIAQ